MAELADTIDVGIRDAVTDLREHGYSWAEICSQLGVTRQAAPQRWGEPVVTITRVVMIIQSDQGRIYSSKQVGARPQGH
jgi:hypothetical protein